MELVFQALTTGIILAGCAGMILGIERGKDDLFGHGLFAALIGFVGFWIV